MWCCAHVTVFDNHLRRTSIHSWMTIPMDNSWVCWRYLYLIKFDEFMFNFYSFPQPFNLNTFNVITVESLAEISGFITTRIHTFEVTNTTIFRGVIIRHRTICLCCVCSDSVAVEKVRFEYIQMNKQKQKYSIFIQSDWIKIVAGKHSIWIYSD